MHSTHELELFPEYKVTQMLFKDVQNAAELRQCAVEGKIKGALINPTMVRCFFIQLRLQANVHKACSYISLIAVFPIQSCVLNQMGLINVVLLVHCQTASFIHSW